MATECLVLELNHSKHQHTASVMAQIAKKPAQTTLCQKRIFPKDFSCSIGDPNCKYRLLLIAVASADVGLFF